MQNKKLKNKNAELQNFAHVASHDLKAPALTIFSFASLISKKLPENTSNFTHSKRLSKYKVTGLILSKLETEKISLDQCCFCIKQIGIYCNHLISVLLDLGAQFSVVHSAQIKFSLDLTRGKNNKVHAKRIAEYAFRYNDKLRAYQPKRAVVDELDILCKLRRKLKKMKNQLSVPLKELEAFWSEATYQLYSKNSSKSIKAIELDIKEGKIQEIKLSSRGYRTFKKL